MRHAYERIRSELTVRSLRPRCLAQYDVWKTFEGFEGSAHRLEVHRAAAALRSSFVQALGDGLVPDAVVELHGLQGAPQHNGRRGVLVEYDIIAGRWKVQLPEVPAEAGDDSHGFSGVDAQPAGALKARPANLRHADPPTPARLAATIGRPCQVTRFEQSAPCTQAPAAVAGPRSDDERLR